MLLKYFFIMFMCEILELIICFCINLYFFFIIGDFVVVICLVKNLWIEIVFYVV